MVQIKLVLNNSQYKKLLPLLNKEGVQIVNERRFVDNKVSDIIKKFRQNLGLTQKQFSQKLNLSRTCAISEFEVGSRPISKKFLNNVEIIYPELYILIKEKLKI